MNARQLRSLIPAAAVAVATGGAEAADLEILAADADAGLIVASSSGGGTAELVLAEDAAANFGFRIVYDGVANELRFFGRSGGTDRGPWLVIDRDSGMLPTGPDPGCYSDTTRFADCGNGTVTDSVTGLVWLENAGCLANQTFAAAQTAVRALATGLCGLDDGSRPGDWRLPSPDEWEAVLEPACATAPLLVGNGPDAGVSCHSDHPWATNVQIGYWSSRGQPGQPDRGVAASLFDGSGSTGTAPKSLPLPLWAVRPAHP